MYLVNKDIAYVACIPDFVQVLNVIIGHTRTSMRLFGALNEKILGSAARQSEFESIKEVFVDHIIKTRLTNCFADVMTSKILMKRGRDDVTKAAFYFHTASDIVKCLAGFVHNMIGQITDFKIREIVTSQLTSALKVYTAGINRHEAHFNSLDELIDLIALLEMLELQKQPSNLDSILYEIEEIRFAKIFHFVQCKDQQKQLTTVNHLNKYNVRTHKIGNAAVIEIIKRKPIFEALFIKYPNEHLLTRLTSFFNFIAPSVDFTVLSQLLRIKKQASLGIAHCIKNCLHIFMQKMEPSVR